MMKRKKVDIVAEQAEKPVKQRPVPNIINKGRLFLSFDEKIKQYPELKDYFNGVKGFINERI